MRPPNPACIGTNCATGGAACLGTGIASCAATCVSNLACTAANVACGTSCTNNCGKIFTGAACAPPTPPTPSCSDPGALTGTNDSGQSVMYVPVSTFIAYGGAVAGWVTPANGGLSYSNGGATANTWVYAACSYTDHVGFCPGNSGYGWCPYVAVSCSDPKTMQYMLSPTGVNPKCVGP